MKIFPTFISICLICFLTAQALPAQVEISNITIGQYDFFNNDGTVAIPNSSFGYIELDVEPDPTEIYYLNIVTEDINANPQWIIQNFPILPTSIATTTSRKGMDFDIRTLGIEPGQDLGEMLIGFQTSPMVQTDFPAVPLNTSLVVNTIDRKAFGGAKLGTPDVPSEFTFPLGVSILFPITDIIKHDSTAGVQEEDEACLAGALARSIDWLNREENLGSDKTAQQWYECLRDADVGSSGPDATTYEEDLAAKDSIFKALTPKARMKILDKCNAVDSVPGVPQETATDVVEFLCNELPNRDVELHYDQHIITVTGKFKVLGITYICYRDDETQGEDTKGDAAEKMACIVKDTTTGNYNFRGSDGFWKIKVLISEWVDSTTSVANIDLPEIQTLIRPNPGHGQYQVNINSPNAMEGFVQVIDLSGAIILNRKVQVIEGENLLEVNLEDHSAGVYFLRLMDTSGRISSSTKLMKL